MGSGLQSAAASPSTAADTMKSERMVLNCTSAAFLAPDLLQSGPKEVIQGLASRTRTLSSFSIGSRRFLISPTTSSLMWRPRRLVAADYTPRLAPAAEVAAIGPGRWWSAPRRRRQNDLEAVRLWIARWAEPFPLLIAQAIRHYERPVWTQG